MKKIVLILVLVAFIVVATEADICRTEKCRCEPEHDPVEASCSEADLVVIPVDLPPGIRTLTLDRNKISTVENTLRHYSQLQNLNLGYNEITGIQRESFYGLELITFLDLSNNILGSLGPEDLKGLRKLETLILKENSLESLLGPVFSDNPNLKVLDLSYNRISFLDSRTLFGAHNLQKLILTKNLLTQIPFESFSNIPHLRLLDLNDNPFSRRPQFNRDDSPFLSLHKLEILLLSGCKISELSPTFFNGLEGLRVLDLSDNLLSAFPKAALRSQSLELLAELHIGLNYFRTLSPGDLGALRSLETFVVRGCHPDIPLSLRPETFKGNSNLRALNVTSCQGLTEIEPNILTGLAYLKSLNFRASGLRTISEFGADWNSLEFVDFSSNPLNCDCSLAWIADFEFDGKCFSGIPGLRGKRLTDLKREEDFGEKCSSSASALIPVATTTTVIIGVSCSFAFVFMILIGIAIYRRIRHRGRIPWRNDRHKRKFRRRGVGRISKDDIVVVPVNVGDTEGYEDVVANHYEDPNELKFDLPLGSANYPDIKTSVL